MVGFQVSHVALDFRGRDFDFEFGGVRYAKSEFVEKYF